MINVYDRIKAILMSIEGYCRIVHGVESIFLKSILDKSAKKVFILFQAYNVEKNIWTSISIT